MITIHVITKDESHGIAIAEWLIREKLVHESVDIDYQDTLILEEGGINKKRTFKLTARTKALLFRQVENGIQELFVHAQPLLYSTPLLNMDSSNQKQLIDNTLKT